MKKRNLRKNEKFVDKTNILDYTVVCGRLILYKNL